MAILINSVCLPPNQLYKQANSKRCIVIVDSDTIFSDQSKVGISYWCCRQYIENFWESDLGRYVVVSSKFLNIGVVAATPLVSSLTNYHHYLNKCKTYF